MHESYVEVVCVHFLSIAAHSIHTRTAFLTLVVAAPTVFPVRHWVQTFAFAANLRVLAFLPTLAAVDSVRLQIHTRLLAAVSTSAACDFTNLRVFVTCRRTCPSCKDAACSSKGSFLLAFGRRKII